MKHTDRFIRLKSIVKLWLIPWCGVAAGGFNGNHAVAAIPEVDRFRVFEGSVKNLKDYGSKFSEVKRRRPATAPVAIQ
jgi:hypothetical protein